MAEKKNWTANNGAGTATFSLNVRLTAVPAIVPLAKLAPPVLLPSTFWKASPEVGSPLRVRIAFAPALVIVAAFARNTTLSSVALAVCTQTPSASVSVAATVYSKRSRLPPSSTLASCATLRLFERSASSAPRSRRMRTLLLPPATVTASLNVTSTTIFSPTP